MQHRTWTVFVLSILASAGAAGQYNPDVSIGDQAAAWVDLPGVDGKTHSLDDLKDKKVVVVVFTCNSCPYAVDAEDRLISFGKEIAGPDSDVALVAINVNKIEEDSLPAMKKRAAEKGFSFPYLFDESQQIAKDYGAQRTPEFFVLDQDRKIVYMGAMDDSPEGDKITKRFLQDAVKAASNGSEIAVKETPPVGCAVRYARARRTRPSK